MKIQLIIDEKFLETEVQIYAKEYNKQIEQLMKQLQIAQKVTVIDGYLQQEIHMLKIKDIYFIYAEGSKVYLQTTEHEFESKRKLYELEEMLSNDFVRVSKSTLVNIDKIASIQMGRIGTMSYFNEKGYTGFGVSRDTSPTFTDVRNIINAGHPSLLRLDNYKTIDPGVSGGHMVTLVGYETYYDTSTLSWYQQFIVHDNWTLTGTQVW